MRNIVIEEINQMVGQYPFLEGIFGPVQPEQLSNRDLLDLLIDYHVELALSVHQ